MYSSSSSNGMTSSGGGGANWQKMNSRTLMADPMGPGDYAGESNQMMAAKEIFALKQDNAGLQAALYDCQVANEKLRGTIRKMKVDNGRLQLKLKRVSEVAKAHGDITDFEDLAESIDYKNVKDFLLIGGPKDPLDTAYQASVKDMSGREFKTGERYLWFRMAEHFGDVDAAKQLLVTDDAKKAHEIVDKVKNFDQGAWDAVKVKHFEEYQRMKFDQNRPLRCLLLKTAPHYLAIATQDKVYGTGWRKQRIESDRTQLWDGENLGGKVLMKLRDEYSAQHSWLSTVEEQEAKKAFDDNRRTVWRRMRPSSSSYNTGGGGDYNNAMAPSRGGGAGGGRDGLLGKRGRGGSVGGAFGANARRGGGGGGNLTSAFPGTYYGHLEGYTNFATPETVIGYGRNNGYTGGVGFGGGNFKRGRR